MIFSAPVMIPNLAAGPLAGSTLRVSMSPDWFSDLDVMRSIQWYCDHEAAVRFVKNGREVGRLIGVEDPQVDFSCYADWHDRTLIRLALTLQLFRLALGLATRDGVGLLRLEPRGYVVEIRHRPGLLMAGCEVQLFVGEQAYEVEWHPDERLVAR